MFRAGRLPQQGRRARSTEVIRVLTGMTVAFGLSTCSIVIGALIAVGLERVEVLPDGWWPLGWILLAAIGTAAAGGTVREVAGARHRWAIALAGLLVFLGALEIARAIDATGADAPEWPLALAMASAFVVLLSGGAALYGRRDRQDPRVSAAATIAPSS